MKREQIKFSDEVAESFANEGERLISKGFVKTQGFEETIAFVMSLNQQVWQIAQQHKSFRMELYYDAETLNVNYYFFGATDRCVEKESKMTRRELRALHDSQDVQKKIKKASDHIFEYLENEGFALAEASFLFMELGQTLKERQRFDPLRKLSDLKDAGCPECYSEFVNDLAEQFKETASSYAES